MAKKRFTNSVWANSGAIFSTNRLPEDVAVHVYTEAEHEEVQRLRALYVALHPMIAMLGLYGEISARNDRVSAVMDALAAIDGGTYNEKIGGENVDG
jgi:hypothetical protein